MRRKSLRLFSQMLILILLCAVWVSAQEDNLSSEQLLYKPSPIPDRIVLTWNGNPSVSQAVTWRTDTSVEKAVAQVATAAHGPDLEANTKTIDAISTELETNLWTSKYHSVTFKDLQPNTLYVYRVGNGENWSEWLHFRTASAEPEPFTFLYFGDVQNDIKEHGSRVIREAFKYAPNARFMIFGGDLAKGGLDDKLWGEFFNIGGWMYGMIPMVPTPGNTEYNDGVLTPHWRAQFTLPMNGLGQIEETSYFIDFQGVRIISLNSQRRLKDQGTWLNDVLSNNPNRWTIITFHHPLFTLHPSRADNDFLIDHWKKAVFDKHQIDLILTGHDHAYGRSGLIDGTVYVVSVTALDLAPVSGNWMERSAEQTQFFQVIKIEGDRLLFEARTATGELYDSFELYKQNDKTNILTNRIPENVPERRKL